MLKESWVASECGDQSAVIHILDMREKLAKLHDIVTENLCTAEPLITNSLIAETSL